MSAQTSAGDAILGVVAIALLPCVSAPFSKKDKDGKEERKTREDGNRLSSLPTFRRTT